LRAKSCWKKSQRASRSRADEPPTTCAAFATCKNNQYVPIMTAHELQEIFRQLPAGAFTVHVVERTPIEVAHSDFASVSPGGTVVTVWDTEGHFHFIDALSVTRIASQAPAGQAER
jgi:hypothetical protein